MHTIIGRPRHTGRNICMAVLCLIMGLICGCRSTSGGMWMKDTTSSPTEEDIRFMEASQEPPTADTLYAMAGVLAGHGDEARAEYVLKTIVDKNPSYAPAYSKLARLCLRQQRYRDAIDTLQAGTRACAGDSRLHNNLGMCQLVNGNETAALAAFTAAAGIQPQNARYRSNMAVALGLMGRYEEALSLFLQIQPPMEAHENMSVLAAARKDEDRFTYELLQRYRLKNH